MTSILIVSFVSLLIFIFVVGRYLLPDLARQLGAYVVGLRNNGVEYAEMAAAIGITIMIAISAAIFKGGCSIFVAWLTTSDLVEFSTALRGTFSLMNEVQHPANHVVLFFVAPLLKFLAVYVMMWSINVFMLGVNRNYADFFEAKDEFFFLSIGVIVLIAIEVFWHTQYIYVVNLSANIAYLLLEKLSYVVIFLSLFWIRKMKTDTKKLFSAIDKYVVMSAWEQKLVESPVLILLLAYAVTMLMSFPYFLGLQWLLSDVVLLLIFAVVLAVSFFIIKLVFSNAWNFLATIVFDLSDRGNRKLTQVRFMFNGHSMEKYSRWVNIAIAVIVLVFVALHFKSACMFAFFVLMSFLLVSVVLACVYLLTSVLVMIVKMITLNEPCPAINFMDMLLCLKVLGLSFLKSVKPAVLMALISFMLITVFPKTLSDEVAINNSVIDPSGDVLYVDMRQEHHYVPLTAEEIPEFVKKSIVNQEDKGFYKQNCLKPNLSNWHGFSFGIFKRGGSNINCQLVKNYVFRTASGYPRDISRKISDMIGAYMLSLTLTPDEIMEKYVNIASFHGAKGYCGLNAASLYAFGKPVGRLNELEQLYLVSTLPRSRYIQNLSIGRVPYSCVHEEYSTDLVKQILLKKAEAWYHDNLISRKEFNMLRLDSLRFTNCRFMSPVSVGTRFYLINNLQTSGRNESYIKLSHEEAINNAYAKLKKKPVFRKIDSELQTAAVVVEVRSGRVIGHFSTGLVDYCDYRNGYPMASLCKPAIVLEMLAMGASADLTLFDGQVGNRKTPKNAEKEWSNQYVNINQILSRSLNAPFANIRDIMNPKTVFLNTEDSYRRMGLVSDANDVNLCSDTYNYPLGNRLMTVMEVATLYQTILNDGVHIPLTVMRNVDEVVTPQTIYDSENVRVIKKALHETVQSGTMSSFKSILPPHKTYYAKTGSSSRLKDGWCAFSDGNILIVAWASYGRNDDGGEHLTLGTEPLYGYSTAGLFSVLIYREIYREL